MDTDGSNCFLSWLNRTDPVYKAAQWQTWLDVEVAVNRLGLKAEVTDGILRPLLSAMAAIPTASGDVLLLLCWQSLCAIHSITRKYDRDDADRWSTLVWHFMQVLHRMGPAKRTEALGRKIFNDTKTYLVEQYELERRRGRIVRRVTEPDDDDDDQESELTRAPAPAMEFAVADFAIQRGWAEARLRSLVENEHLTRPQYLILRGRHLYGRSMADLATQLGVAEQVARKRYQRALERLKIVAPGLSPYAPDSPLYKVGRVSKRGRSDGE